MSGDEPETDFDSAGGETISKKRAVQELRKHGVTSSGEFFKDMGDHEEYEATKVLEWLGY